MKPYVKTYRVSKNHKATECDTCAECAQKEKSPERRRAAQAVLKDMLDYSDPSSIEPL